MLDFIAFITNPRLLLAVTRPSMELAQKSHDKVLLTVPSGRFKISDLYSQMLAFAIDAFHARNYQLDKMSRLAELTSTREENSWRTEGKF